MTSMSNFKLVLGFELMGLEALSNGESGPGLWWQPQFFAVSP
jgi:hypothetical protein